LKLEDTLGFTLQVGLQGSRGRGVAIGNPMLRIFDRYPGNPWAEDHAEAVLTTSVGKVRERPLEVGVTLVSELIVQVNVDLANPDLIEKVVREAVPTSRALGFLKMPRRAK
jgi:hypothetical protein